MKPRILPALSLAVGLLACSPIQPSQEIDKFPGETPEPQPGSTSTVPGEAGPVPEGLWGGEGISLIVGRDGAILNLDCARGTVDQPMRSGPSGFFQAVGTYTSLAGPEPVEGERPSIPASYYGAWDDDDLRFTLSFINPAGETVSQLFRLGQGVPAVLSECQ